MLRLTYFSQIVKRSFYPLSGFATLIMLCNSVMADNAQDKRPVQVLSNLELMSRADLLRTTEMSMTQRSLNYQWLDNHQHDNAVVDGKALSELGDRIFGDYIEEQRHHYFGGNDKKKAKAKTRTIGGINLNAFDYNVDLSSSKVNVGLIYQFK